MFFSSQEYIFALDLGTTRFRLAMLAKPRRGERSATNIDIVSQPAAGMRRGMVNDFFQAKACLENLLAEAERKFQVDIHQVIVGIAGSHLDSFSSRVSQDLLGRVVSQKTLHTLFDEAMASAERSDKEMIHSIPVAYQIDNRDRTTQPIGFSGHMIHGFYLNVFADKNYVKDVIRLCNECGLQVRNVFAEPVASASVCVPEELKSGGVAFCDIGGGTTDCLVFQNGKPCKVFTVSIGGQMMTRDLAIGLNLNEQEAERVKIALGLSQEGERPNIPATTLYHEDRVIGWRDTLQILSPRMKEFASLLARELLPYKGALSGGIVLSGGGSELQGICDFLSYQLKVKVQHFSPSLEFSTRTSDPIRFKKSSRYATLLGLLNLQLLLVSEQDLSDDKSTTRKYLNHFFNWIKELS